MDAYCILREFFADKYCTFYILAECKTHNKFSNYYTFS